MNHKKLKVTLTVAFFALIIIGLYFAVKNGEPSQIIMEGKIAITPDVKSEIANDERTLFIVLYDASNKSPMPFGAMKTTWSGGSTEAEFLLTKENLQVMFPDKPLPKIFRVKARIDSDGQAGLDQPGDFVGELEPVVIGTKDVNITIKQKIL